MARKKGWIIFLIVFGFFVFMGVMFILGIKTALEDRPVVRDDTVLQIDLAGLVTEHFSREAFSREFEGANIQLHDIRKALELARVDKRIRGVYLRMSYVALGWAKAQELKNLLEKFKDTGKFMTAFLESCNEKSYYIALAADDIFLQPHSIAEFNGLAVEYPFVKRMFNKLGVEPQVNSVGKYKSAGEMFSRESMSPAHREATEALLNDFYDEFLQAVCARRDLERPELQSLLNKGIFLSKDALENQLVDELKYESEVLELLKEKVYAQDEATDGRTPSLRTIRASRYARLSPEDVGLGRGSKIALIYAIGAIVPGRSGYDPLNGRTMGSQSVVSMLKSVKNNRSIKAVVLRVDSPGGSAVASDEMWAEIEEVQKKKPVVVSMSDVAASGGYWISMGCSAIVAQPTTITGSIGVVGTIFNLAGAYDKLGIDWETVKIGDHADMLTDKRALTDEEWQIFKELTNDTYETFLSKVAEGRGKSRDEVHAVAQGRVWSGKRALQYGLIDSLGGLDAALTIAKEKAGLEPDAKTRWVIYPHPKGFFESLFEKLDVVAAKIFASRMEEWAFLKNLPTETKSALRKIAVVGQFRSGEVLAVEPFVPVVE
ncbi:MAG: signal peptide peptidase SppA [bacterium]